METKTNSFAQKSHTFISAGYFNLHSLWKSASSGHLNNCMFLRWTTLRFPLARNSSGNRSNRANKISDVKVKKANLNMDLNIDKLFRL